MAFAVVVPADSDAHRPLGMISPAIQAGFWREIKKLEPALDARPTVLPDSTGRGMEYRFKVHVHGLIAYFVVLFRFADTGDENTLTVAAMSIMLV